MFLTGPLIICFLQPSNYVHGMLQILQREREALCSELQLTEVIYTIKKLSLIKQTHSRLVELWQEICKQLLEHDNAIVH